MYNSPIPYSTKLLSKSRDAIQYLQTEINLERDKSSQLSRQLLEQSNSKISQQQYDIDKNKLEDLYNNNKQLSIENITLSDRVKVAESKVLEYENIIRGKSEDIANINNNLQQFQAEHDLLNTKYNTDLQYYRDKIKELQNENDNKTTKYNTDLQYYRDKIKELQNESDNKTTNNTPNNNNIYELIQKDISLFSDTISHKLLNFDTRINKITESENKLYHLLSREHNKILKYKANNQELNTRLNKCTTFLNEKIASENDHKSIISRLENDNKDLKIRLSLRIEERDNLLKLLSILGVSELPSQPSNVI